MADYSELKRLAEAATPGPWSCGEKSDGRFWHIGASGNQAIGSTYAASKKSSMASVFEANARFIAAANPAAVRALIAEVEALRSALSNLLSLYEEDEGCRTLPQYIAGVAAMSKESSN